MSHTYYHTYYQVCAHKVYHRSPLTCVVEPYDLDGVKYVDLVSLGPFPGDGARRHRPADGGQSPHIDLDRAPMFCMV